MAQGIVPFLPPGILWIMTAGCLHGSGDSTPFPPERSVIGNSVHVMAGIAHLPCTRAFWITMAATHVERAG
jgi:hypothetical protein